MTTPNQNAGDTFDTGTATNLQGIITTGLEDLIGYGAYQVSSGGYGQGTSESGIMDLIHGAAPTLANGFTDLTGFLGQIENFLLSMPLQALQMLMPYLPDVVVSAFDTVEGAVSSIMGYLGSSFGHTVNELETWLTTTFQPLSSLFNQVVDILQGNVIVPINTAMANIQSWFNGLPGQISSAVTAGVAALQTLIQNFLNAVGNTITGAGITQTASTVETAIQGLMNGIGQALGHTGDVISSDIQTLMSSLTTNLFGGHTVNATISTAAVPNVTVAMSTDLKKTIDAFVNGITGATSSGNSPAAIQAAAQAIPHQNIVPVPNPGTGAITHDQTTSYGSTSGDDTHSVTVGSSADCLVVRVTTYTNWLAPYGGSTSFGCSYGGVDMALLGSYQSATEAVGNHVMYTHVYGLMNPASGANNLVISCDQTANWTVGTGGFQSRYVVASSYIGVEALGTSTLNHSTGGSPSGSIVSSSSNLVISAISVLTTTGSYTGVTGVTGSPAETQRGNSEQNANGHNLVLYGGDGAGASTATISATATPGSDAWAVIMITLSPLPASVIGSGLDVRRVGTSTTTMSANAILTGSFYDTIDYVTSDITWDPTTSKATVSLAGWYNITVSLYGGVQIVLYKNGTPYRVGPTMPYPGSSPAITQASFTVYLSAGNYVQVGTLAGGGCTGEANGIYSYFSMALSNRSVL